MNHDELLESIENKEYLLFQSKLLSENEVDIATFLEEIPKDKALLIFRLLPKDLAAEVFANLFWETQQMVVEALSDAEVGAIVNDLYADDAADFLEEMPAGIVKRVLKNASHETREHLNHLLHYPENSAGTLMTVEFVDIKRDVTVAGAIEKIRKTATESVTINPCYVTDKTRRLEGIITVKRLLLSEADAPINQIMQDDYIFAQTTDDREDVARLFEKYDVTAVPVVDSERRLVGIITIDDIVDVLREEATEDFQKMAAMRPSEKPYLRTGVLELTRNRIGWLLVLMISGMITGGILQKFEAAIIAVPILVSFVPMLTNTGGNSGSQSSTMIIRGMALAEVRSSDYARILWKELRVAALCGIVLSSVTFMRIYFQYPQLTGVAITVSISLLFTVILAKAIGGLLPIIAKALKADPAVMAAPVITTIVDACSLFIFFMIAHRVLGI